MTCNLFGMNSEECVNMAHHALNAALVCKKFFQLVKMQCVRNAHSKFTWGFGEPLKNKFLQLNYYSFVWNRIYVATLRKIIWTGWLPKARSVIPSQPRLRRHGRQKLLKAMLFFHLRSQIFLKPPPAISSYKNPPTDWFAVLELEGPTNTRGIGSTM